MEIEIYILLALRADFVECPGEPFHCARQRLYVNHDAQETANLAGCIVDHETALNQRVHNALRLPRVDGFIV